MPKQRGSMQFEGTMNEMTFYKMGGKYYVRWKRQVNRNSVLRHPKYARFRENGSEFGLAVKAGKLLRDAVKTLFKPAGCRGTSTRLLQLMLKMQKADAISVRGQRNVGVAIQVPGIKELLKGFEFGNLSKMESVLIKPYEVNILTGRLIIANLIPLRDVKAPTGATHFTLSGGYADVNFANDACALQLTNEINLPLDDTPVTIDLITPTLPAGMGTKFYLLKIAFYQMVNGVEYELNNGLFNGMVVAEVG